MMKNNSSPIDRSIEIRRRDLLRWSPVALFWLRNGLSAQQALPQEYIAELAGNIAIGHPLVDCTRLNTEIAKLKDLATAIGSDPASYGQQYLSRAVAKRAEVSQAIATAEAAVQNAKIDETIAAANLALSLVFLGLGIALSGPIAVGTIAGLEILAGPSMLAWQILSRKQTQDPNMVLGYAADRVLLLTEFSAANSASSIGKAVARSAKGVSLLTSTWAAWKSTADTSMAQQHLTTLLQDLKKIDILFVTLGTNKTAWANAWKNTVQAATNGLSAYVAANQSSGCAASFSAPLPLP